VVTVSAQKVELKEGWFDMGFKKILSAVSPVASVINKSGPVAKILGMEKKGSTGLGGGFGGLAAAASKNPKFKNALEEGRARVAPVKAPGMKKGGAVKKAKAKSKATRGDGICRKGKTRGRIC